MPSLASPTYTLSLRAKMRILNFLKVFFTHFYKLLQFIAKLYTFLPNFFAFLRISTHFYEFSEFLQNFTKFSQSSIFSEIPKLHICTHFYKFLQISKYFYTFLQISKYFYIFLRGSMIILTNFYFLAETNGKTCLHAKLSIID